MIDHTGGRTGDGHRTGAGDDPYSGAICPCLLDYEDVTMSIAVAAGAAQAIAMSAR